MGFLDSVKAWFRSEASELGDAKSGLEARLDEGLTRRERQLEETPSEAMERLQAEIADNESSLHDLEDKIAHGQAKADAVADLEADAKRAAAEAAATDADPEDILDLDSEEIE